MAAAEAVQLPWYREPTKDQWYAWMAAWLGWTLDAFDFTIFLLIIAPIAKHFDVPVTEVTFVLTLTLWGRFIGATANGWLADRVGRRAPLMISIAWYSVCNFIAGLAPTFWVLFLFRALLGIGMGAEWPAGAALAMETWPARSRGFMGALLQGSWGIGFLLSSALYALLYGPLESLGPRLRLARPVNHRRPAGTRNRLCPDFCQGAGGLGGKPATAADAAARSPRPAALDFQARVAREYDYRVRDDGIGFRALLRQ